MKKYSADIFKAFKASANSEKAAQMSAYMKNQFLFLGLSAVDRKAIYKNYFKQIYKTTIDWDFIWDCYQQPEREFQYLAIEYLTTLKKLLSVDDLLRIKRLIVTKSWWDTTDSIDALVGVIALKHPEVSSTLIAWSSDENIWLRRVAIDFQLQFKEKTDTALLETIIVNNLNQDEFFINKAIGWSLRSFSKTNPAWVSKFIEKYKERMSPLSIREATKYL